MITNNDNVNSFFLIVCALRKTTNIVHCSLTDFENRTESGSSCLFMFSLVLLPQTECMPDTKEPMRSISKLEISWGQKWLYTVQTNFSHDQVNRWHMIKMYFFLKSSLNQTLHQKYVLLKSFRRDKFCCRLLHYIFPLTSAFKLNSQLCLVYSWG